MLKVAALCVVLSGCSIALQSKPTKGIASAQSDCSTSSAYWITDAALAVASITAAAVMAATQENPYNGAGLMVGSVGAVGFLGSSNMGRQWRSECASATTTTAAR